MEFLGNQNDDKPFFMMLSTPACHEPWTSAPQYKDLFSDVVAQRTGSYNTHGKVRFHMCVNTHLIQIRRNIQEEGIQGE